MKHERNNPICDPWDSQGNEKIQFLFLLVFVLTFFIRNENVTSEECKTENRLKKYCSWGKLQAFKVGRLLINKTFIYKGLTVT